MSYVCSLQTTPASRHSEVNAIRGDSQPEELAKKVATEVVGQARGRVDSGSRERQVYAAPSGRIYPFGWQGGSATVVNMKVRSWDQYRWSAVKSYTWSPSHDQCGMLRPFGTSSAEWW